MTGPPELVICLRDTPERLTDHSVHGSSRGEYQCQTCEHPLIVAPSTMNYLQACPTVTVCMECAILALREHP